MLDALELGPEAVVMTRVGGVYGDVVAGRERWVRAWEQLPAQVRSRLVLENDDARYGVADVHWIHARTGVRLVFDYLHHWCHNPARIDQYEALAICLQTWPGQFGAATLATSTLLSTSPFCGERLTCPPMIDLRDSTRI